MNPINLLSKQEIVSTRKFQSEFSKLTNSEGYYNIVRNGSSVGVFMPKKSWDSLLEDLEALGSDKLLSSIVKARNQKGGKTINELLKKYK